MRTLSPAETDAVHGGFLLAAYAGTQIKSSGEISALYGDAGYGGVDLQVGGVKCGETTNVTITTTHTSSSPALSCGSTSSFPFIACTLSSPSSSVTTTTMTRNISCTTSD